jgi:hypothetical protein
MFSTFLIATTLAVGADHPASTPYLVVDFGPLRNLPPNSRVAHLLTFVAERPGMKTLKWVVVFEPAMTPKEIREKAVEALGTANREVVKIGDTKLLLYDCKTMSVKTEAPGKKEIPEDCRPTVKSFKDEKEALEGMVPPTSRREREVLELVSVIGASVIDRTPAQYFVVDFAPVGKYGRRDPQRWITFAAERPGMKALNWTFEFSPDLTPEQVRDAAVKSLAESDCKVQKVADTKLLFYGCTTLLIKTERPGMREFPEVARPTVTRYKDEEAALEGK